jgi:hypothetical protein
MLRVISSRRAATRASFSAICSAMFRCAVQLPRLKASDASENVRPM